MPKLLNTQLDLDRCPHCNVDRPNLRFLKSEFQSTSYSGSNKRFWRIYACERCGGLVTAWAHAWDQNVVAMYPSATEVDVAIPERAKEYLVQALNSLGSPVGAVMLAASAVDAMLKAKDYREGTLFSRIDKAATDHVITPTWHCGRMMFVLMQMISGTRTIPALYPIQMMQDELLISHWRMYKFCLFFPQEFNVE